MQKNYEKIREMYQDQEISASLGLVIGAVTESQQLIDHALRSEQEGGPMSMCNALEELRREGVLEGQREGRLEGIRATIRTCKKFNISEEDIMLMATLDGNTKTLLPVSELPRILSLIQ